MIKNTSCEAVIPLVKRLNNIDGLYLEPIAGTVLSALAEVTYPLLDGDCNNLAEKSCHKNQLGVCEHDVVMDKAVKAAADVVRGNLKIARNVVNPIVKTIYDQIVEKLEQHYQEKINPLSISLVEYPAIWKSETFISEIKKYADAPVNNPKLERIFPQEILNKESLFELISTPNVILDREVQEYLGEISGSLIRQVMDTLFLNVPKYGEDYPIYLLDFLAIHLDFKSALVTYLLAKKFFDNIPDGVNMPLVSYQEYLSIVIEQAGRVICQMIDSRDYSDKSGRLVLSYPLVSYKYLTNPDQAVISVNGSLYQNWLEKGGSPEVLFGAFMSQGIRMVSCDELLEKAESLKAEWNRHSALLDSQAESERFQRILSTLKSSVAKQIVELNEEYVVIQDKAVYQDRLLDCLEDVQPCDTTDLYSFVRKVVCEVLFAHTNAHQILCAIDRVGEKQPNLDPREAALIATIDVVSDWLVHLFKVED